MLRLHFPNRQTADIPLNEGLCPVVRHASGQILAGVSAVGMLLLGRFSLDGRGLWLQVSHERVHVHVNGRPVKRMALVRAGDQINIDGQDMHILGRPAATAGVANALLRGYGNHVHGRSFALNRNWVIGSSEQADVVLEDKALPALYVRIQPQGDCIDLQVLAGGSPVLVNGELCTQATLWPGDQILIHDGMRLVVESPEIVLPAVPAPLPAQTRAAPPPPAQEQSAGNRRGWSWLLLAALAMGGILAALLLFGPR